MSQAQDSLGRIAYDTQEMGDWDDLPAEAQEAWEMAAEAVAAWVRADSEKEVARLMSAIEPVHNLLTPEDGIPGRKKAMALLASVLNKEGAE